MSVPKAPIKIKQSGDTHLPDVESDLDVEEGTSSLAKLAKPRDQGGRPMVRHAGVLVAPDTDTDLDATAGARDASTSRQSLPRGTGAGRDAPGEDASRGSRRPQRPQQQPRQEGNRTPQGQGTSRSASQRPSIARSPTRVWIGALAAAVLLVRLMR